MNARLWTMLASFSCLLIGSNCDAVERYHTSTIKWVYPLASGDFMLVFDTETTQCFTSGPPRHYHVIVGQNGITAEGSKRIYAAALTALAARMEVDIAFDDATASCYINPLVLKAS